MQLGALYSDSRTHQPQVVHLLPHKSNLQVSRWRPTMLESKTLASTKKVLCISNQKKKVLCNCMISCISSLWDVRCPMSDALSINPCLPLSQCLMLCLSTHASHFPIPYNIYCSWIISRHQNPSPVKNTWKLQRLHTKKISSLHIES